MRLFLILSCLTLCQLIPGKGTAVAPIPNHITSLSLVEGVLVAFETWNAALFQKLNAGSEVISTAAGPIEYSVLIPKCKQSDDFKPRTSCSCYSSSNLPEDLCPVVLVLHGAFGGYDQAELVGDQLLQQGFTILAPSRPGYLRTPLYVGQTNAQQADAMVALLDALGIDKVAVLGFSAGSQIAFEFAVRHPDRTWALVLECLGAHPSDTPEYKLFNEFLELANGEVANFGSFLFDLFTKAYPLEAVKFILSNDNNLSPCALRERIRYVYNNKYQLRFALNFIQSVMPLEPRIPGILNDIGDNLDPWYTLPYNLLKTPTIIIQSTNDSSGSYPEAKWVAKQIPGVKFVKVEDSGHFIWLGPNASSWESKLGSFLKKHDPCRCRCSEPERGWITGSDG